MAALRVRPVLCELKQSQKPPIQKAEQSAAGSFPVLPKLRSVEGASLQLQAAITAAGGEKDEKIVLQPRLSNLRSYGSDPSGVMIRSSSKDGGAGDDSEISPFFATLSEYIESSKKSQDFEIISGRLAMIVFAATVTTEVMTGNSLFRKMDLQGLAEGAGVCMGAVTCAAIFAWFSSARNKVGRMFTLSCNTFIDSLIDQIIDGLFYEENELKDWNDDI